MVGVQGVSGIDNQLVSAYAICYPSTTEAGTAKSD